MTENVAFLCHRCKVPCVAHTQHTVAFSMADQAAICITGRDINPVGNFLSARIHSRVNMGCFLP